MTKYLIALNVFAYLAVAFVSGHITSIPSRTLIEFGGITSSSSIYSVLTAMFLHAGVFHLLMNMLALKSYGQLVESIYSRHMLTIYFLGGIASSLAVWMMPGRGVTIGASGAICALLGASLVYHFMHARERLKFLVMDAILLAAISLLPNVSLTGHLFGFLAGCALYFVLPRK